MRWYVRLGGRLVGWVVAADESSARARAQEKYDMGWSLFCVERRRR